MRLLALLATCLALSASASTVHFSVTNSDGSMCTNTLTVTPIWRNINVDGSWSINGIPQRLPLTNGIGSLHQLRGAYCATNAVSGWYQLYSIPTDAGDYNAFDPGIAISGGNVFAYVSGMSESAVTSYVNSVVAGMGTNSGGPLPSNVITQNQSGVTLSGSLTLAGASSMSLVNSNQQYVGVGASTNQIIVGSGGGAVAGTYNLAAWTSFGVFTNAGNTRCFVYDPNQNTMYGSDNGLSYFIKATPFADNETGIYAYDPGDLSSGVWYLGPSGSAPAPSGVVWGNVTSTVPTLAVTGGTLPGASYGANVLFLNGATGNDLTAMAGRADLAYRTWLAAVGALKSNNTLVIFPGTYRINASGPAGSIPNGCKVLGFGEKECFIYTDGATAPGNYLTFGNGCEFEGMTWSNFTFGANISLSEVTNAVFKNITSTSIGDSLFANLYGGRFQDCTWSGSSDVFAVGGTSNAQYRTNADATITVSGCRFTGGSGGFGLSIQGCQRVNVVGSIITGTSTSSSYGSLNVGGVNSQLYISGSILSWTNGASFLHGSSSSCDIEGCVGLYAGVVTNVNSTVSGGSSTATTLTNASAFIGTDGKASFSTIYSGGGTIGSGNINMPGSVSGSVFDGSGANLTDIPLSALTVTPWINHEADLYIGGSLSDGRSRVYLTDGSATGILSMSGGSVTSDSPISAPALSVGANAVLTTASALNPANLSAGTAGISITGSAATATTASNVLWLVSTNLPATNSILRWLPITVGGTNYYIPLCATNGS